MRKLCLVPLLSLLVVAVSSVTAQGAVVTVGSPLTATFSVQPINVIGTLANTTLPEAGSKTVSPVTGTVIRWHVLDAEGGPFKMRVLRPGAASSFTGVGTSEGQTPTSHGLQTFTTSLPIQAGDLVALQNSNPSGDEIGLASEPGAEFSYWTPVLAEGSSLPRSGGQAGELAFNVEVQPTPTITAINPLVGPSVGGTAVTILGTDFENTTGVKFGATPATSFTVNSEGAITATAPSGTGAVTISVTTLGGSVTSAGAFSYTAPTPTPNSGPGPPTCKVPKLIGKKVKGAKKALIARGCKLGKVTRKKGVTTKTGKVVKQGAKPGAVKAAGSKISVSLG